eukprot:gnl/Hemi2/18506_TR6118_c0_g1_i1.p1 gnl/Hemi2/18506_TR6118_c0_g1~~gnl/Hemi2/18506_TR6118_c0_g1_i1.p1  ORF type:complete len:694 (+),score=254.16 gnl/Hemi2/18506_TR6118_c0_g1_i1:121-2202(+)
MSWLDDDELADFDRQAKDNKMPAKPGGMGKPSAAAAAPQPQKSSLQTSSSAIAKPSGGGSSKPAISHDLMAELNDLDASKSSPFKTNVVGAPAKQPAAPKPQPAAAKRPTPTDDDLSDDDNAPPGYPYGDISRKPQVNPQKRGTQQGAAHAAAMRSRSVPKYKVDGEAARVTKMMSGVPKKSPLSARSGNSGNTGLAAYQQPSKPPRPTATGSDGPPSLWKRTKNEKPVVEFFNHDHMTRLEHALIDKDKQIKEMEEELRTLRYTQRDHAKEKVDRIHEDYAKGMKHMYEECRVFKEQLNKYKERHLADERSMRAQQEQLIFLQNKIDKLRGQAPARTRFSNDSEKKEDPDAGLKTKLQATIADLTSKLQASRDANDLLKKKHKGDASDMQKKIASDEREIQRLREKLNEVETQLNEVQKAAARNEASAAVVVKQHQQQLQQQQQLIQQQQQQLQQPPPLQQSNSKPSVAYKGNDTPEPYLPNMKKDPAPAKKPASKPNSSKPRGPFGGGEHEDEDDMAALLEIQKELADTKLDLDGHNEMPKINNSRAQVVGVDSLRHADQKQQLPPTPQQQQQAATKQQQQQQQHQPPPPRHDEDPDSDEESSPYARAARAAPANTKPGNTSNSTPRRNQQPTPPPGKAPSPSKPDPTNKKKDEKPNFLENDFEDDINDMFNAKIPPGGKSNMPMKPSFAR